MPLTTPLKKSHFFQKNKTNKIFVSKTNKQNQVTTRKSDTHFNTQPTCFFLMQEITWNWKGFFQHNIIKKEKSLNQKWDEIMIVIFQEIKTEKEKTKQIKQKQIDEELFFSVCACCVLTKFFFESSYSLLGFMLLN